MNYKGYCTNAQEFINKKTKYKDINIAYGYIQIPDIQHIDDIQHYTYSIYLKLRNDTTNKDKTFKYNVKITTTKHAKDKYYNIYNEIKKEIDNNVEEFRL